MVQLLSQFSPVTEAVSGDEVMEHKPGVKRPLEGSEGEGSGGGEGEMEVTDEGGEGAKCGGTKRAKEEGTPGSGGPADKSGSENGQGSATHPHMNFPLPGETGIPCLVKVSSEQGSCVCVCARCK